MRVDVEGFDLLESGSPDRRVPRWPVSVVLAGLLIVGGGAAADSWQRSREVQQVLTAVEQGQDAVLRAKRRLFAALVITTPVMYRNSVDPGAWRDQDVIREIAGAGAQSVRASRSDVALTAVLPWHDDIAAARDSYTAYVDAMDAHLTAIERDYGAVYDRDLRSWVRSDAARSALLAVTTGAMRARVEELFADPTSARDQRPSAGS